MDEAPPYSAAAVEVVRLPAGRSERDQVAVEEPAQVGFTAPFTAGPAVLHLRRV